MEKLYKFCWDWHDIGGLEGIFVVDDSLLQKCYGMPIVFPTPVSDVFIHGILKPESVSCLEVDEMVLRFVDNFSYPNGSVVGTNPLYYIVCDKCRGKFSIYGQAGYKPGRVCTFGGCIREDSR